MPPISTKQTKKVALREQTKPYSDPEYKDYLENIEDLKRDIAEYEKYRYLEMKKEALKNRKLNYYNN